MSAPLLTSAQTRAHGPKAQKNRFTDASDFSSRREWLKRYVAGGLATVALPCSTNSNAGGTPASLPVVSELPPGWPAKPLQLIIPWPAGGATDLTLRLLCEEAEAWLGQRIIISNRPGAGGTLVAPALKAAEPDGYTLGQLPITVFRYALMNQVPWDPIKDLAPVIQISGTTFGVLVPVDSTWYSVNEMLEWARRHPGKLLMGSTGIGTTAHLAMEEILLERGIAYVHVPYKGTADQMLAIASGQLMAGVNSTGFAPWLERGQMRLLATFGAERSRRWSGVPTMRESGFTQSVYTSPWGIATPRATPQSIIRRLHDVFFKAMHSERHIAALAQYEQQLDYLGTEAYKQAVLQTVEHEKVLLRRMKLLPTSLS